MQLWLRNFKFLCLLVLDLFELVFRYKRESQKGGNRLTKRLISPAVVRSNYLSNFISRRNNVQANREICLDYSSATINGSNGLWRSGYICPSTD